MMRRIHVIFSNLHLPSSAGYGLSSFIAAGVISPSRVKKIIIPCYKAEFGSIYIASDATVLPVTRCRRDQQRRVLTGPLCRSTYPRGARGRCPKNSSLPSPNPPLLSRSACLAILGGWDHPPAVPPRRPFLNWLACRWKIAARSSPALIRKNWLP
jgi:hypothetical protein